MKRKGRVGILLSGRGSNFEAIYNTSQRDNANFEVVVVISNKPKARGLERAREFGLPVHGVSKRKFSSKEAFEHELVRLLKEYEVNLVCLAGYMRIVGEPLLEAYPSRIMNIHPALLPSFPGLDGQKQALEYGVKVSGCTVHFVDSGVDTGPIIQQNVVPVLEGDDEEKLSQRILIEEHKIYSEAIQMYFDNRLRLEGRRVHVL